MMGVVWWARRGLLDDLPQEQMDLVDHTVFDASSSARVRAEALGFVMDHTEGFEEPELEVGQVGAVHVGLASPFSLENHAVCLPVG